MSRSDTRAWRREYKRWTALEALIEAGTWLVILLPISPFLVIYVASFGRVFSLMPGISFLAGIVLATLLLLAVILALASISVGRRR